MEQIYDLCEKCKPKVKFEITKQDGILKQYLFRLGEFSFLFEKDSCTNKEARFLQNSSREKLNKKIFWNTFLFYMMNFCIFFLITLTIKMTQHDQIELVPNQDQFNITSSSRKANDYTKEENLNSFSFYFFVTFSHFQHMVQHLILFFDNFFETYVGKSLVKSIEIDSAYTLLLLFISYLITCFCVSWCQYRDKFITKIICFVWLIHLFFICSNYNAYLQQFKLLGKHVRTKISRYPSDERMSIYLKYTDSLGFLIQLMILVIMIISAFSLVVKYLKNISKNKRNESDLKPNQANSDGFSKQNLYNRSSKSQHNINLKPSRFNIPIGHEFSCNQSIYSQLPSTSITSNYFLKSKSAYSMSRKTAQNQLDSDYHSDEENEQIEAESSSSSLISGITNLYLTRNQTAIKSNPRQSSHKQNKSQSELQNSLNVQSNMIKMNNKSNLIFLFELNRK